MVKKGRCRVKIGGIALDSTSQAEVLGLIAQRIKQKQKTFVVTPNPEFVVYAHGRLWFKRILNSAHFSIPDGVGLIIASRLLADENNTIIKQRISGSDLVTELLNLADLNRWTLGIAGARRGDAGEAEVQISCLRNKYPEATLINLDQKLEIRNLELALPSDRLEIVLACHGMGKQEKWISDNFDQVPGLVFMGAGGSLDFLTGFAKRAPFWVRKIGFEWLWRGIQKPSHFRRVWTAVFEFSWLVLKEKFSQSRR